MAMATPVEVAPEIILYDLACTKNVCFSPVVWRVRLVLNYKRIPYKTVFLEFHEIEPTLKGLGLAPHESASASNSKPKYTVPVIHHVPTNTYLMDSTPIAQFLESTYPEPAVPLTSPLGREIETKARSGMAAAFQVSVMPRELLILSPGPAQEYFRRTREATLNDGRTLEDLMRDRDGEEKAWAAVDESMRAVGELLLTNKAEGPFVLGAEPSYTDFFLAGALQSARVVNEEVFQRHMAYPGFGQVYDACLPYMDKKD